MVRLGLLSLLLLGLSGCYSQKSREPISLTPHGDAVRANMKAQIIHGHPHGSGPIRGDGVRAAAVVQSYRDGTTESPVALSTSDAAGQ